MALNRLALPLSVAAFALAVSALIARDTSGTVEAVAVDAEWMQTHPSVRLTIDGAELCTITHEQYRLRLHRICAETTKEEWEKMSCQ